MNLEPLRNLLDDRRILAGLGVVLLAGVVAYYVSASGPAPTTIEQAEQPSDTTVAPTAQNVDPVVHARLMTLRRDVEAAPRDTALLFQLARMEFDAHQLEPAVATYERLLAVAPDHRQAYLDLAQALVTLGRPEDAERAMERLLDQHPNDLAALYNLGAIAANQGDAVTARRHWTEVAAAEDVEMARQARESLAELERIGSVAPAAAPPATAGGGAGALPPGHPPISGGFETSVITGPPLPAGSQPAAPAR